MKSLKNLMNRLAAEGRDITELERMVGDLEEAETCTDVDYYEGQIYGVLTGLCIMGYITPDEVNSIQNAVEEGDTED